MAFLPEVLKPKPDPAFVRELRKIDPDLRVTFGYERYLVKQWAIERKMPPERYFAAYASLLEADLPRFVEQPVYDTDQPIFNEEGEEIGFKQIGTRNFDLAPDHEWVMFAPALDGSVITELKRTYAWERNHPYSRAAFEKKQQEEIDAKAKAKKDKRIAAAREGVEEAFREVRKEVVFGYGKTRNER